MGFLLTNKRQTQDRQRGIAKTGFNHEKMARKYNKRLFSARHDKFDNYKHMLF